MALLHYRHHLVVPAKNTYSLRYEHSFPHVPNTCFLLRNASHEPTTISHHACTMPPHAPISNSHSLPLLWCSPQAEGTWWRCRCHSYITATRQYLIGQLPAGPTLLAVQASRPVASGWMARCQPMNSLVLTLSTCGCDVTAVDNPPHAISPPAVLSPRSGRRVGISPPSQTPSLSSLSPSALLVQDSSFKSSSSWITSNESPVVSKPPYPQT